jgi:hypothetical protein
MTARLPRLLVSSCVSVLLLAACQPHSDVAAGRPAAVAAAQRISLDPDAAMTPEAAAGVNGAPVVLAVREASEVHLPDGTVGVRVAKRYYHTISVCRQPDGSFSSECPARSAAAP